jgi:hypothetical protein
MAAVRALAGDEVLFGDATPFPHGFEFLETVRATVACAAQLLSAQQRIDAARELGSLALAASQQEESRLGALFQAMATVLTAFRASRSSTVVETADLALDAVRTIVEQQRDGVAQEVRTRLVGSREAVDQARADGALALRSFLLSYDLPDTAHSLTFRLGESGYVVEGAVDTPFDLLATFALAVPSSSRFASPCRAGDFARGVVVHDRRPPGWLSADVRRRVTLDRLYLTELDVGGGRARLVLRRSAGGGAGYVLAVRIDEPHATLQALGPDGPTSLAVLELEDADLQHAVRLAEAASEAAGAPGLRRAELLSARFDGVPLADHDEPATIATRLLQSIAPIVRTIAARSGAPGELVLRRTTGSGRRDEVYVARSELYRLIEGAPARYRGHFDLLGLDDATAPDTQPNAI